MNFRSASKVYRTWVCGQPGWSFASSAGLGRTRDGYYAHTGKRQNVSRQHNRLPQLLRRKKLTLPASFQRDKVQKWPRHGGSRSTPPPKGDCLTSRCGRSAASPVRVVHRGSSPRCTGRGRLQSAPAKAVVCCATLGITCTAWKPASQRHDRLTAPWGQGFGHEMATKLSGGA